MALLKKSVFAAQISHPAIEYRLETPDHDVMFDCDERQITQVFTNILKNAAESIEARPATAPTENGVIAVHMACENGRIVISIADNGVGFPAGDIAKMFEPYVTTRSKGTGLGLSIVKKIIEDHKGLINIENIDDGGAKVTLSFLQHCDINAAS